MKLWKFFYQYQNMFYLGKNALTESVPAGKKNKISNENDNMSRTSRTVKTVEESVNNKTVSVSTMSRRSNETEGIDDKFAKDGITERKTGIAEREGSKGLNVNNQLFTSRNSRLENNANRPVKMERVFYSETREREKIGNIESEVCSSESEISVDSIEGKCIQIWKVQASIIRKK